VIAAVLVAYAISLLARGANDSWPWLDNWGVAIFELTISVVCGLGALRRRTDRVFTVALALALASWSIGHLLLAIESSGGRTPPVLSAADIFYLGFYPLTYLALMLVVRSEMRNFSRSAWLDGAIAGLGSAAVVAAFAFRSVLHNAGGHPLGVATNLAYPIGDAMLFALVIAMSATLPGRHRMSWVLIATGCALNVLGDTVNLFSTTIATSHTDVFVNGMAWPTALVLMSFAAWVRPQPSRAPQPVAPPAFALPGCAALAALAVLSFGTVHHVTLVALMLAVGTLLVVGVRTVGSLSTLRSVMAERQQQAVTDLLTGLGNRRKMAEVLEAYFGSGALDATLAFLFIDLDHFKEINDAFGHSAGDELLRQLGPRLRGALRGDDLLLRIGGDELAVVLRDTDAASAERVAGRLSAGFDEPFDLEVVSVRVGASIGIALAPAHATEPLALLRCADAAMYRAKSAGLPYTVYSTQIDDVEGRRQLVEDLHAAVRDDGFVLHYQPQLGLEDEDSPAVEALLRWFHPVHGPVPPLAFLPLAEEAGLMPALTTLVLEKAVAQAASWQSEGRPVAVGVNISASNLLDAGFAELVASLLQRSGLRPSLLTIEITETTVISDFEHSRAVIADLHALGVRISIDDFGAGFTSLA